MADKFAGKQWSIISQDDDCGDLVRQGFDRVVKDKKLNVVSTQIYTKGQADFSSEIRKVKQSGAEVLMAGGRWEARGRRCVRGHASESRAPMRTGMRPSWRE